MTSFTIDPKVDTTNVGYIDTLRFDTKTLTDVLGDPQKSTGHSNYEWKLLINGRVYSVYDWKHEGNKEDIEWHIGGIKQNKKDIKQDMKVFKEYVFDWDSHKDIPIWSVVDHVGRVGSRVGHKKAFVDHLNDKKSTYCKHMRKVFGYDKGYETILSEAYLTIPDLDKLADYYDCLLWCGYEGVKAVVSNGEHFAKFKELYKAAEEDDKIFKIDETTSDDLAKLLKPLVGQRVDITIVSICQDEINDVYPDGFEY